MGMGCVGWLIGGLGVGLELVAVHTERGFSRFLEGERRF